MFAPVSSSKVQAITALLTAQPPEFVDPKFPAHGQGREGSFRCAAQTASLVQSSLVQSSLVQFASVFNRSIHNPSSPSGSVLCCCTERE